MNELERKLCLFRQIEGAANNGVELGADSDIVWALDAPGELACRVGGCAIKGQHLLDYEQASGASRAREEIDRVVAPSCAKLDVPHDADRELARIQEELLQPPEGA